MNELQTLSINYDDEQPTVLGRDLHEALGVKEKYTEWFKRMCGYGFEEGKDYLSYSEKSEKPTGGRPSIEHQLTIPMAKEICMLQRTEKGKMFRAYFIQIEEQWNTPEAVMSRALRMANKKLDELKHINIRLEEKIEQDKPKVLFADAVATADTSILVGDMAKLLKQNGVDIGQKRLFDWLRNKGYLIKRGLSKNMPTQKSMDLKLFEVKERAINNPDGTIRVTRTTKVTGAGQRYFINKFLGGKKETGDV